MLARRVSYVFIFLLMQFFSTKIAAQVSDSITAEDITPFPGNTYVVEVCSARTGPVDTGINIQWDYATGYTSIATDTITYTEIDSASGLTDPSYIRVLHSFTSAEDYIERQPSMLSYRAKIGVGQPRVFSNNLMLVPFPLEYGKADSAIFYCEVASEPTSYYGISKTIVDGYGTLILPSGTYTNVFKISWITDGYMDMNPPFVFPKNDTAHVWYQKGIHHPLLVIDTNRWVPSYSWQTQYMRKIIYNHVDTYDAGQDISIYPNPSEGMLHFELAWDEEKYIEICDLSGRIVRQERTRATTYAIELSDIAAGPYIARIISPSRLYSQVIIHR